MVVTHNCKEGPATVDTIPFGPPVECKRCGGTFLENAAVFIGGLKAGTATFDAWKAAGKRGDKAAQLLLEANAPDADKLTKEDVEAYAKPAVSS